MGGLALRADGNRRQMSHQQGRSQRDGSHVPHPLLEEELLQPAPSGMFCRGIPRRKVPPTRQLHQVPRDRGVRQVVYQSGPSFPRATSSNHDRSFGPPLLSYHHPGDSGHLHRPVFLRSDVRDRCRHAVSYWANCLALSTKTGHGIKRGGCLRAMRGHHGSALGLCRTI
jgi:hypothetical protein